MVVAAASAGATLIDRRAGATKVVEAALGGRVADVAATVGHPVGADVGEAIARATGAVHALARRAVRQQHLARPVLAALAGTARAADAAAAIGAAGLAGTVGGAAGRDTEGDARALRLARNVDSIDTARAGGVLLALGVAGTPGRRELNDPATANRSAGLRDVTEAEIVGGWPRTGDVRRTWIGADGLARAEALAPAIDTLPVLAGLLLGATGTGGAAGTAAGLEGEPRLAGAVARAAPIRARLRAADSALLPQTVLALGTYGAGCAAAAARSLGRPRAAVTARVTAAIGAALRVADALAVLAALTIGAAPTRPAAAVRAALFAIAGGRAALPVAADLLGAAAGAGRAAAAARLRTRPRLAGGAGVGAAAVASPGIADALPALVEAGRTFRAGAARPTAAIRATRAIGIDTVRRAALPRWVALGGPRWATGALAAVRGAQVVRTRPVGHRRVDAGLVLARLGLARLLAAVGRTPAWLAAAQLRPAAGGALAAARVIDAGAGLSAAADDPLQVGPTELRALNVRIDEASSAEVGAAEVGVGQGGATEAGPSGVDSAEGRPGQGLTLVAALREILAGTGGATATGAARFGA